MEMTLVEQRKGFPSEGYRVDERIRLLRKLKKEILKSEDRIYEALCMDLHKSRSESYLTEVGIVIKEIDHVIKNIRKWSRKKRVGSGISIFPSKSYIYRQHFGQVLIISPWNYPFQLAMLPLIGAVAGGNCVVLKTAEATENTSKLIREIVKCSFNSGEVICVPQGVDKKCLLKYRYDLIFFTGSPKSAKVIMKAASEHLTPLILELGGKSPCYVSEDASIKIAAKRIAWGKLMNAGQTCIAPDYILADRKILDIFVEELSSAMKEMYDTLAERGEYVNIISDKKLSELEDMLKGKNIYSGGKIIKENRTIEPTIILDEDEDDNFLDIEIFAPVLPVLGVEDYRQAMNYIGSREKPLATYIFTENRGRAEEMIEKLHFGGGCVNDVLLHVVNSKLPFGGVGSSGMGCYHGRYSYEAFTRLKGIVKSNTFMDLPIKYPPYGEKKFKFIRKFL